MVTDRSPAATVGEVTTNRDRAAVSTEGSDTIQLILDGRYLDPESAAPLQVSTRSVVIADSLTGIEADIVKALDLGNSFAVVSDHATFGVLGSQVETALRSIGSVESIVLPDRPHADIDTAAAVRRAAVQSDCLIAIGSGTINDLCKYAAAQDAKPYVVFATAPSMNGYVAENASITVHGHKRSLRAAAPIGVFMDLGILSNAPRRMICAGFGDSLCRPTAQADWLMSHLVRGSPYRALPFLLLADDEDDLIEEPEALLSGDLPAMSRLARTLILSGFGMTICGSSDPASQGEHLISHYLDMMQPADRPMVFHGEQVGVTTVIMARLQERMLQTEPPRLQLIATKRSAVVEHFGNELGQDCWQEFSQKRLTSETVAELNQHLAERWTDIRDRVLAVTRSAHQLENALRRIGAPLSYSDIHLTQIFFCEAIVRARQIRGRFTFLDLAADAARLNPGTLL